MTITSHYFKSVLIALAFIVTVSTAQAEKFSIAVATSLDKIRQDGTNLAGMSFVPRVEIEAAQDETESFQLVVIPNEQSLTHVAVNAPPLVGPAGQINVRWHIVGYIKTGNPSYKVDHLGWWPDILFPAGSFDVPSSQVQPLWFAVDVPADAAPGVYKGKIDISTAGDTHEIMITLRVRNFRLPRPGTFSVPMGLYMWAITDWYFGKGQPDEQMTLEQWARWCEFLAKYRITPKNIGFEFVKRRYGSEPAVVRESENHGYILALQNRHDPLTVDMTALHSTVGKLAPEYFPDYSYGFYRLPSAPRFSDDWPEKDRLKRDVNSVMAPIRAHFDQWRKEGFSDKVYIYGVDEPPSNDKVLLSFICDVYRAIKKSFPTVKILQTGNCDIPEFVGLVDIWCPKTNSSQLPFFADRIKAGDTVWSYTAWTPIPPVANIFVDEPSSDYRILFWQSKKLGLTGFLWWSTFWMEGFSNKLSSGNPAFPEVPIDLTTEEGYYDRDVRCNWGGTIIYPGKDLTPLPSIRLEVFRDGIEDYEYLMLLEKLTSKAGRMPEFGTIKGENLLWEARQLCNVPDNIWHSMDQYTHDNSVIFERRREIGNMIEQLSDIVSTGEPNSAIPAATPMEFRGIIQTARDTTGIVIGIKIVSQQDSYNLIMNSVAKRLSQSAGKSVTVKGTVKYNPDGGSKNKKWIEITEFTNN
jgi:hypothetical protein